MADQTTAKDLGYRFPAEWERQEAVWFAWPVRDDLWGGCLESVRDQLAELYLTAARFQTVRVLCPAFAQADLRGRLNARGDAAAVELFDYETDDVWIRDFGPLFLLSADGATLAVADWRYNAWGNKFPRQRKDDRASAWIAEQLRIPHFQHDWVLEGGAVESNGAGCALTTEAVLLHPNRNGSVSKTEVAQQLTSGLGVDAIIWLENGLEGDDTDGHIDNLARFYKEDGLLLAATEADGRNASRLLANETRLRSPAYSGRKAFQLKRLPLPDPIYHRGEVLAASYLNFIILNGAVLVPTYGQPDSDEAAMAILDDCFPEREVLGFDCRDVIKEGGALHCMSQHQPARYGN